MTIQVIPLPALRDNYIWTFAVSGGAVVVDPGAAAPVLRHLQQQNLSLTAILITHHHPDHIAGVEELQANFPACAIFAPDDARAGVRTQTVGDGMRIRLAERCEFSVLWVPGHTRSHLAYHDCSTLFCGDTLFSLGCGRMFEGTPTQFLSSLDRICALAPATVVCCTHEYTLANARFALSADPDNGALRARVIQAQQQRDAGSPSVPSSLQSELDCNPFLRTRSPAIQAAAERHLGRAARDRVEVFAALRGWKDVYA